MDSHNRQAVTKFFEKIRQWETAYAHLWFSYFSVFKDGTYHLLHGVLYLNNRPIRDAEDHFKCQSVLAGSFDLAQHGLTKESLVEQLIQGEITTPVGKMVFAGDVNRGVSAHFDAFNQEGLGNRSRWTVLSLTGGQAHVFVDRLETDWILKGADRPFDSIHELFSEYHLGNYRGDRMSVDVVAFHPAEVVLDSYVGGSVAKPAIFLADGLDVNKASIGYKVVKGGRVLGRGMIKGENLRWESERLYWSRGEGNLSIEVGAVLQLFANYDGTVHHESWVGDPSSFQNSRRVALETFDNGLEVVNDYLFEKNKERKSSRDFEVGVALLLDMLGFSVAQIGGSKRLEDAIDIVATTPHNNVALVECTTGLLNNDNKLSKLIDRTANLRRSLSFSGNGHVKVLPVIVTAKTRDDVKADLDAAKRLKIVVITREDLLSAMARTVTQQNPDQLFDEGERSLIDNPLSP